MSFLQSTEPGFGVSYGLRPTETDLDHDKYLYDQEKNLLSVIEPASTRKLL